MSKSQYQLLTSNDHIQDIEECSEKAHIKYFKTGGKKYIAVLVTALCCSTLINIYHLFSVKFIPDYDLGRSPYSGLGYDILRPYEPMTDYWGENETLSTELWEAIDTSPMGVALDNSWAAEHGLPKAGSFPWDDSKGTYYVKVFHQLHCLKLIRKLIVDLRNGEQSIITWEHCQHCLDSLRKDLICTADDTPVYGKAGSHLGEGQLMRCRNFDKLVEWTQSPERNACYRSLSDYKTVQHSLERHAFCPEDSPYYEIQKAYFEKWGHVDPWVAKS